MDIVKRKAYRIVRGRKLTAAAVVEGGRNPASQ